MNKCLQLSFDISFAHYSTQDVLRLVVHHDALCSWCVGMSLLRKGLIDSLTVVEQRTSAAKVRFVAELERPGPIRARLSSKSSEVALTKNSLDYMEHFFLTYYRDSIAEVDHIDLEAIDTETGNKAIYITFQVLECRPPISAEEAQKRLDG